MMSRPPIDRFSEEQTARVVRGSDAPDIEAGVSAIRQVLKTLPTRPGVYRSEEHTSELQSLMRISYAVFCLKKKKQIHNLTQDYFNIKNRYSTYTETPPAISTIQALF